jgi:hypothetical protein
VTNGCVQQHSQELRAASPPAAPPSRLANEAIGRRGQASPNGESGADDDTRVCQVVLTGRATSVPFTAVMTGPQRTTTDNTTAPLDQRRSLPSQVTIPIWLWEQGVA